MSQLEDSLIAAIINYSNSNTLTTNTINIQYKDVNLSETVTIKFDKTWTIAQGHVCNITIQKSKSNTG